MFLGNYKANDCILKVITFLYCSRTKEKFQFHKDGGRVGLWGRINVLELELDIKCLFDGSRAVVHWTDNLPIYL